MKAAILFLLSAACFALTARADLTIVQKVETKGTSAEVILKVKDDKARLETTPQMTTILNGKTGETITLMHAQKRVIRISGDKAKAIAEMASKYTGGTPGAPRATSTGKKTTVGNYETEEYVSETPTFKARYWIAAAYPEAASLLKQLQAAIPTVWNDVAKGMLNFHDLPGLPLRTQIKMGENEVTSTIISIKNDPLNESEFMVPKDFAEIKIPNIPPAVTERPAPAVSATP